MVFNAQAAAHNAEKSRAARAAQVAAQSSAFTPLFPGRDESYIVPGKTKVPTRRKNIQRRT